MGEFTQNHSGGILGILDMFSGGAIGRMTIFALNIMPYISASIIIQLLTSVSPHLESLKKEGESGKQKLNQYTRYATVALASIQPTQIVVIHLMMVIIWWLTHIQVLLIGIMISY